MRESEQLRLHQVCRKALGAWRGRRKEKDREKEMVCEKDQLTLANNNQFSAWWQVKTTLEAANAGYTVTFMLHLHSIQLYYSTFYLYASISIQSHLSFISLIIKLSSEKVQRGGGGSWRSITTFRLLFLLTSIWSWAHRQPRGIQVEETGVV